MSNHLPRFHIDGHHVVAVVHNALDTSGKFARAFGNGISLGQMDNAIAAANTYMFRNGHSYDENRRLEYGKTWNGGRAAELGAVTGTVVLEGLILASPIGVTVAGLSAMVVAGVGTAGINLAHIHQANPAPEHVFEGEPEHGVPPRTARRASPLVIS